MTCCVPATALGPVGSAVNRTSTNLHVCGTYSQWLEVGIKQIDKIQRESEGGKKKTGREAEWGLLGGLLCHIGPWAETKGGARGELWAEKTVRMKGLRLALVWLS